MHLHLTMTQEQPGTVTVPPVSGYTSRLSPFAKPDFSSAAWQTDLYYGRGEFGQRGRSRKRNCNYDTEKVEPFPAAPAIKKKRIHGLMPNAPPADANKKLVAVKNRTKLRKVSRRKKRSKAHK